MLAFNPRNHGSAIAGICEASFISTKRNAVRWPLSSVKYTASGLKSASMDWMVAPSLPALAA
jgi:hypothetical protein